MSPQKPPFEPALYGYLKKFQQDPTSRVFAPLAEAYRKAGLPDEAIEIAREGLKIHPKFVGGRVALARALFDKRMYAEVVTELAPVAQDVPDNLVAQKLLAESFLMLGHVAEALSAYKMYLYFSPQDFETAKIVAELEAQAYERGALVLRTDPVGPKKSEKEPEGDFSEKKAGAAIGEDPTHIKMRWMKRIERLQVLLQRVERYKVLSIIDLSYGDGSDWPLP
jgi:tetratricopeptide (TPR) repeat protein